MTKMYDDTVTKLNSHGQDTLANEGSTNTKQTVEQVFDIWWGNNLCNMKAGDDPDYMELKQLVQQAITRAEVAAFEKCLDIAYQIKNDNQYTSEGDDEYLGRRVGAGMIISEIDEKLHRLKDK